MYSDIIYDVQDPVAIITLNRPDSLNAWTATMGHEIEDAVERANADSSVVGIVITGAGRAFCAGVDMKLLNSIADSDDAPDKMVETSGGEDEVHDDLAGRFTYLLGTDKPILAAINGAVAGMAFPFALSCDLRVVSSDSLFLTAFAQRGLIAEHGLGWLLPKLVGPSVAMDLLMSSRRVGGEEALRIGLANYLVEPDQLLSSCIDYIEKLAQRCSPLSLAIMKRQVYEDVHRGVAVSEVEADRLMLESLQRKDFAEGVRSFVEKREPEFERISAENKVAGTK